MLNPWLTVELVESMGRLPGIREPMTILRPMKLMGDRHYLRAPCSCSGSPADSAGPRTKWNSYLDRRTYATD